MRWDLPVTTWVVFAALAGLSVLTLTVVIFKLMQFRRMGVGHHKLGETILDDWLNGRPDEAQRKAQAGKTVLARVLGAVMSGLRARPGDPANGMVMDFSSPPGRSTMTAHPVSARPGRWAHRSARIPPVATAGRFRRVGAGYPQCAGAGPAQADTGRCTG